MSSVALLKRKHDKGIKCVRPCWGMLQRMSPEPTASVSQEILEATRPAEEYNNEEEDIDELFGPIDWATANFCELEAQWRSELATIEKDNVGALLESGERGQLVLPAVNGALAAVTKVEEQVSEYDRRLKMMGREISQIAEINRALDIRARNQEALLAELIKILGRLDVPDEALNTLKNGQFGLDEVEAAKILYRVLGDGAGWERGMREVRAVAERLSFFRGIIDQWEETLLVHLISLLSACKNQGSHHQRPTLDLIRDTLAPYQAAIQLLLQEHHAGQRMAEFRRMFEEVCRGGVTAEVAAFVERLKTTHLASKTPDDKPSFLLSGNRPSSGFDPSRLIRGKDLSSHVASGPSRLPALTHQDRLLPEQLLEYILLTVVEASGDWSESIAAIWGGQVDQVQMVDFIFGNVRELLIDQLLGPILRSDPISSFPILAMLDRRSPEIPEMAATLESIQERATKTAREMVRAQVEAILETPYSARKRSGIFPAIPIFPRFVLVLERSLSGSTAGVAARKEVDAAYEAISTAIFSALSRLAVEAAYTADEKDNLNATVMTVQNCQILLDGLESIKLSADDPGSLAKLETVKKRCREEIGKNMTTYCQLSLPRILGRLPDYFDGLATLLSTSTSPEEAAYHSSYDKATARKVAASWTLKEAGRAVEGIRERVVKHFKGSWSGGGQEAERIMGQVWVALKGYAVERVQSYVQMINQVYPATDVQLAFSAPDIAALFDAYPL